MSNNNNEVRSMMEEFLNASDKEHTKKEMKAKVRKMLSKLETEKVEKAKKAVASPAINFAKNEKPKVEVKTEVTETIVHPNVNYANESLTEFKKCEKSGDWESFKEPQKYVDIPIEEQCKNIKIEDKAPNVFVSRTILDLKKSSVSEKIVGATLTTIDENGKKEVISSGDKPEFESAIKRLFKDIWGIVVGALNITIDIIELTIDFVTFIFNTLTMNKFKDKQVIDTEKEAKKCAHEEIQKAA